jgi:phenolic acid decarboxylase
MYFKNERAIDYRVHGGMVGGRWVKGQEVHIVRLADGVYKLSWNEPTGTCVSVAYNLNEKPRPWRDLLPALDRAGAQKDHRLPE